MKTYKHLYETMLNPENHLITLCAVEAAQGKIRRKEVYNSLINIKETKKLVTSCLENPNYVPCEDNQCTVIDGANHKKREIEKPNFYPEQIIHHVLIEPFKPVVLDGLYEHVYGCLPPVTTINKNGKSLTKTFGLHTAIRQLKKWLRTDKKTYICEADIHHAYASVRLDILYKKLERVVKDRRWLRVACQVIHYSPYSREKRCGLVLGHYPSPWLFNFYLKDFDHFVASLEGVKYLRFADNLFLIGHNKRKVHKALKDIQEYLGNELGLELNKSTQIYRFEYQGKYGTVRGRAVNALGIVLHHNRYTLRKSILRRVRRKATNVKKKGTGATWHDGSSVFALLSWLDHTQTFNYFSTYIKPGLKVRLLRNKVRNHSKKIAPVYTKIRRQVITATGADVIQQALASLHMHIGYYDFYCAKLFQQIFQNLISKCGVGKQARVS